MVQLKLGVGKGGGAKDLDLYDKETVQGKLVTDAVCHHWRLFCKHLCHCMYVFSLTQCPCCCYYFVDDI